MNKLKAAVIPLALFCFTLLLFSSVLKNGFVAFDDDIYVYNNVRVAAGLTADGIRWAFSTLHDGNWIPLSLLSHLLDVSLFGLNPSGHHLTSLLLHALNCSLLFVFLQRTTGASRPSLCAALFFAVHPMHVESVAWVAERKDLICGLLFLLALLAYSFYAASRSCRSYLLTFFLVAASLMAKPMAVSLPLVLLLLDYWPLCRTTTISFRRLLVEKIPFALLSMAAAALAWYAQQARGNLAELREVGFWERVTNAITGFEAYLQHLIWPVKLAVFYPLPVTPSGWRVAGAVLLLTGITTAAILTRQRYPYLLTGWLWFLISMLPVSGIVQVGQQHIADRYTYLPYIGLFIMTCFGGTAVAARWNQGTRVFDVVAAVALLVCCMLTVLQLQHWRNSNTLFEHALAVTERNPLAHNNLGMVLKNQGHPQEALEHFRKAVAIHSRYANARYNMGIMLESHGDVAGAIDCFRAVLQLDPADLETRRHLEYLEKAIPDRPSF